MTFDELMDCYTNYGEENRQVYKQLLGCAKSGNLIPFFGAGISYWAYHGWKDTLTGLAKNCDCKSEVESLLKEYRYEEAASRIESERGKEPFCEAMGRLFSPDIMDDAKKQRPPYMNYFPQVFRGSMVTTNFDRCIERIFQDNHITVPDRVSPEDKYQSDKLEKMIHDQKPMLVKMHGDVHNTEHLVFTQESYDNTYGKKDVDFRKPLPKFLKLLLMRSPILFLGCSLNNDRTCRVIRKCSGYGMHFAVMELPKETENTGNPLEPNWRGNAAFKKRNESLVKEQKLNVIWYPYGMHTEALTALFEQLSRDLAPKNPLGCMAMWTAAQNEERNHCKLAAIGESASLRLMAETGYSFLAPTGKFRDVVDRFLSGGGLVQILLNDATTNHPFLTPEQKNYIAEKREQVLEGYKKLNSRYGNRITLKTLSYYLPATILITDRYGYFEPYIQNEEMRQQNGFDTFELMFDKKVSGYGYHVLLNYFDHLFTYGKEY